MYSAHHKTRWRKSDGMGTMARSGVGSLTVVDGWLNAEAYIKLVKKYVKKDARKLSSGRMAKC